MYVYVLYRQAWLDRVTADRLRELNRLSKEEADRINKLRYAGSSLIIIVNQWFNELCTQEINLAACLIELIQMSQCSAFLEHVITKLHWLPFI